MKAVLMVVSSESVMVALKVYESADEMAYMMEELLVGM